MCWIFAIVVASVGMVCMIDITKWFFPNQGIGLDTTKLVIL